MVVPSEMLIEKLGATEIGPVAALGDALNGAETVLEEVMTYRPSQIACNRGALRASKIVCRNSGASS